MDNRVSDIFNKFREIIVGLPNDRAKLDPYLIQSGKTPVNRLFTRTRIWTFPAIVGAILSCFKETLSWEVTRFLDPVDLKGSTKEAFIKRRQCISDRLFRDFNTTLCKLAHNSEGFLKRWHCGHYLCAIDGTRYTMPYTKELYSKYRQKTGKGYNIARGVIVSDVINRLILAGDLLPNKTEERKAALQTLSSIEFPYPLKETVFVMDRGYPSRFLMNWFADNTAGFIIRAKRDSNPQIGEFMDDTECNEKRIVISLSKNRHDLDYPRPNPLEVRLIKREKLKGDDDGKEPTVFITNLLDSDMYPSEVMKDAYRDRWNVETEIGTTKNELQIEVFSGYLDSSIRQDFFSAMIMYNIETIIRIPCNKTDALVKSSRKYKYQVDMNATWEAVRLLIKALLLTDKNFESVLTHIVNYCLRVRSPIRKGRAFPRMKRVQKLNGKYNTYPNYKRGL